MGSPTATRVLRPGVDATAMAIMIGLTFSWGLNGVAAKLSSTGFSPVFVTVFRSALGGLLVLGWCRLRGIPVFSRDGTLWAGLVAGLLFSVEFLLIFFGFDYTSVGRSSLMMNTMPFWVLIGAHLFLGERITAKKLAGLVLAFAGVAVIFSDRLSAPGLDAWIGDLLTLLAGLCWGATTIVIKSTKLATVSAEKLLLYQLGLSAVIATPLLTISGPIFRSPDVLSTLSLVFQAVYVVAFTFLVWFWLMRRYLAAGLASFTFLTPAFGVLCGGLLLGEPLSPRIGIALALIAAGLLIVNSRARQAKADHA